MVYIIVDICRMMKFAQIPGLVDACIDAANNFAVDYWLQTQLLQAGALWSILPHLFNYDYTLEVCTLLHLSYILVSILVTILVTS